MRCNGKRIGKGSWLIISAMLFGIARPGQALWEIVTADSNSQVGWYASLVLDSNNHPMISYYDNLNHRLKYAYHDGSAWSLQVPDSNNQAGRGTSITRDNSNRPHIAYYNGNNEARYCYWNGSGWSTPELLASGIEYGFFNPTLVMDSSNRLHVAYVTGDENSGSLYYRYHNGTSWGTPSSVGSSQEMFMAVDGSNVPHVAMYVNKNVTYRNGPAGSWTNTSPLSQPDNCGPFISMALDNAGHAHISCGGNTASPFGSGYVQREFLTYFYHNGSSWTRADADPNWAVGEFTSIDTDSNNRAHISYFDRTNWALKYATNAPSGTWTNQTVDMVGAVGYCTSIRVDSSNNPHIAYYDLTNKHLKYAKWIPGSWQISGTIRDGASLPRAGVYVFLDGAHKTTVITQSNGTYSIQGVPDGSYTVTPMLAGYSFTLMQLNVNVSGGNQANQNFTIVPGTGYLIGGYITDSTGQHQFNRTVRVTISGATAGYCDTDANGYYRFDNLQPGDYTITPALDGYTFDPPSRVYNNLGDYHTDDGFRAILSGAVFNVQGTILDSQGMPLSQVLVQAQGNTFTVNIVTGADGKYAFPGLPYGNYTVQPTSAGWIFNPVRHTYTPLGQSYDYEDFTAVKGSSFPQEVKIIGGLFKPHAGEHVSIWYTLSSPSQVSIKLYSLDGVLVKTLVDGQQAAGLHQEIWTGNNQDNQIVASGIYWVDIRMPSGRKTLKVCVVK